MQTQQPRLFVVDDDRAVLTIVGTGVTCLDVLRALRTASPQCEVVLMTGYPSLERALESVKQTLQESGPADDPADLSTHIIPAPLLEVERDHIIRTLERVRGNKAVAARLLGVSRRAFYRQLERHGLHRRVPGGRRPTAQGLEGQ
jgi:DNA-binding NtrC family response regulator